MPALIANHVAVSPIGQPTMGGHVMPETASAASNAAIPASVPVSVSHDVGGVLPIFFVLIGELFGGVDLAMV